MTLKKFRLHRTTLLHAIVAQLSIVGSATAVGDPPVRVVATTQEPGIAFMDGSGLSLNAHGLTTFLSASARLWSEAGGTRQIVVDQGFPAPGTAAIYGTNVGTGSLNSQGDVAFYADLAGGDVTAFNSRGIWIGKRNALNLVARTGDHAPGMPVDVKFVDMPLSLGQFSRQVAFNNQSKIAFMAKVAGPLIDVNRNDGIWVGVPGNLQLVAMENQPAPGGLGNYIGIGTPVINHLGDVAFKSTVAPGIGDPFIGVFKQTSGILSLVTKSGDLAPGAGAGVRFQTPQFSDLGFNNAGDIAFRTDTTRQSFSANDQGIWVHRDGALQKVAMTADLAPGTANQFLYPFGQPVVNSQGRAAFTANLTGPVNPIGAANFGIWSEGKTGVLELVARQGQHAAGLPAGFVFGDDFRAPTMNSIGRIAFMAEIENVASMYGIWAQDNDFNLQLIALVKNPVDGAGLGGTIGSIIFPTGTGNEDGRRSAFNDFGQVAVRVSMSTGVQAGFISNAVAIPEPSTLLTSVVMCALVILIRLKCYR